MQIKKNIYYTVLVLLLIFITHLPSKEVASFQFSEIDQEEVNNTYLTIFKPNNLFQIAILSNGIESVSLTSVIHITTTNSFDDIPKQVLPNYLNPRGYIIPNERINILNTI